MKAREHVQEAESFLQPASGEETQMDQVIRVMTAQVHATLAFVRVLEEEAQMTRERIGSG